MLKNSHILKLKKSLARDNSSLFDIFSVLGDRTRYKIIELLSKNDKLCVSDLAAVLEISISCVSQHLRILEMSGLVESERTGQNICYRYKPDPKLKTVIELM
ncbi:MAG: winged helix-turn-helix transcriptional regulator [Candidatus Taylorbacteria bacterium]|nr:winged helix-turn-helix transcriptional regulator [Candidatus Taylorbacteria bacterium]